MTGHLDFIAAGRRQSVGFAPRLSSAIVVHIPPKFETAIAEQGQWSDALTTSLGIQDRRLAKLTGSLFDASQDGQDPMAVLMVSAAIVDRLFELAHQRRSTSFTPVVRDMFVEYIDENVARLDPQRAAAVTGLGRSAFAHAFRATFGAPLHRYLLERRVLIACQRLPSGEPLTNLALDLGFSNHAHFTTVFRRIMGVTPQQYRNSHGRGYEDVVAGS